MRKKFPKNFERRKQLREYLIKKGHSEFDIRLLLGYSLSDMWSRPNVQFSPLTRDERQLLHDDVYREAKVEAFLEIMDREKGTSL